MGSLIYIQPMRFPSPETHTIQIARTVAALASRLDVLFVVGGLTVPADQLARAMERFYGVEVGSGVRSLVVPRHQFRGLWFPFSLRRILAAAPPEAAFYTRSFRIARALVRWRGWHRRRIFLESHKKAGYYREDPVPNSPHQETRDRFEREGESRDEIETTYLAVDGVFFLHRHSAEAARRRQPGVRAETLWYGWRPGRPDLGGARQGVVYCGSLADHKLFDVLVDALDRVNSAVRVVVYSGDASRADAIRRAIAGRPAASRLEFRPWLEPAALPAVLARFRCGVALQEGLKTIDYLENGVVPIVPDLPSYRDELDDRHLVFFRPDSADGLAARLDQTETLSLDWDAVQEVRDRHTALARAERIEAVLASPGGER